ncbi:MAG: hypothetical protein ACTSVZ_09800 [Promethearchaeota archaeon]
MSLVRESFLGSQKYTPIIGLRISKNRKRVIKIKHIWIVNKISSTMLFYYSYENFPFNAELVSGLMAAMNSFSEVEIQQEGIQSIEMYDQRWVYLKDSVHNLLLIGADFRDSNAKVMRSRLNVIDTLFVQKYGIDPQFWDKGAIDIKQFATFRMDLLELQREWDIASKSMDLGNVLDVLGIFQQALQRLIQFITKHIHGQKYLRLLYELHRYSPQLKEFSGNKGNLEAFQVLQLFIPKIDLTKEKIIFTTSEGQNILQQNPQIGLETKLVKSVFYVILNHFVQSIRGICTLPHEKEHWETFLGNNIMLFLLNRWDFLQNLGLLKSFIRIFATRTFDDAEEIQ